MMTVYRSSQLISGITVLVASLVAFQTNDVGKFSQNQINENELGHYKLGPNNVHIFK